MAVFEIIESKIKGVGLHLVSGARMNEVLVTVVHDGSEQPLNYINHSCNPNCYTYDNDVVAKWQLPAGTELTLDYEQIGFDCLYPEFYCQCNPKCKRFVGERH